MTRFRHAGILALVSGLVASSSQPTAGALQRPSFAFQIVVEPPLTLQATLREAMRSGHGCAAVARPVAPLLSRNVAVILGLGLGLGHENAAAAQEVAVVYAHPDSTDDFEKDVNAAAAKGFRLCGVTIVASIWGKAPAYSPVAVLTRAPGAPAPIASYRIIRTRDRNGEWAVLAKAAAEGFTFAQVIARPDTGTPSRSDTLYVAEKSVDARPLELTLAFSGNAVALKKEIDKPVARGFRPQVMWATSERVNVLMAKPIAGGWDDTHRYKTDDPSRFTISNLDGALIGAVRFRDAALTLYEEGTRQFEYSVLGGELLDPSSRPNLTRREQRRFVEQIDVDGGRGYWPVDFTWRETGSPESLAFDVIGRRQRGM
jgi:hypothetical protein